MTKAGQTCLTTCKIPMNERNLLSALVTGVSGALFFECATRPRPLLNSSTSRSRDAPRHGIKREESPVATELVPRDTEHSIPATRASSRCQHLLRSRAKCNLITRRRILRVHDENGPIECKAGMCRRGLNTFHFRIPFVVRFRSFLL